MCLCKSEIVSMLECELDSGQFKSLPIRFSQSIRRPFHAFLDVPIGLKDILYRGNDHGPSRRFIIKERDRSFENLGLSKTADLSASHYCHAVFFRVVNIYRRTYGKAVPAVHAFVLIDCYDLSLDWAYRRCRTRCDCCRDLA